MAIRIITDSSADYEQDELQVKNITSIPLTISFGEEAYLDGPELSKDTFYQRLLNEDIFPKTAQPSPEAFLQCFEEGKAAGDTIIVILLTSALSGTVQSATLAKDMADYDEIYIIDSKIAVTGIRLLVDVAVKMRDEGVSGREIAKHVTALVPRLKLIAMVDTLEYLHRGGRLTKTQAKIGSLANLKPLITFAPDGRLVLYDKCLGKNRAYRKLISAFDEAEIDMDYPVYFPYANTRVNCERLIGMLKAKYEWIDETQLYAIGPTIGTHCGSGAFGYTFIEKI